MDQDPVLLESEKQKAIQYLEEHRAKMQSLNPPQDLS